MSGGNGFIYVSRALGSATHGFDTGLGEIMDAAALVAWQVRASRTWYPAFTAGSHVDRLADGDGLLHERRADMLGATACMKSQV